MTKLEFIDKINDILIGLNTAESDALGSLYDELMRDNNWQQVRIQASIAAMQGMMASEFYCTTKTRNDSAYTKYREKWGINQITKEAVNYADALVKELKKRGQDEQTNEQ